MCRGKQVGFVHLGRQRHSELVDLHLQAVVEARSTAASFDNVAALEIFGDAWVGWLPDASFELAGFVAKNEAQVGFVGLCGALLLGQNEEEAVEELAFVEVGQIGDVDIFHRDDQGQHEPPGAARAAYLRVKDSMVADARERWMAPRKVRHITLRRDSCA